MLKTSRMYDLAFYGIWDNNINVYKIIRPSLNIAVMYTQSIHHRVDEGVKYTQSIHHRVDEGV